MPKTPIQINCTLYYNHSNYSHSPLRFKISPKIHMQPDSNRNLFLQNYIKTFSFLKAVLLSDRDGATLNAAYSDPTLESKAKKFSNMLIATVNQTNDNINKIAKSQKANAMTLCFPGYTCALYNMNNLVLTLIFTDEVSVPFVKDVAKDLAAAFKKLDDIQSEILQDL